MNDWWSRAACLGQYPELWFPAGDKETGTQYIEARAICNTCDVKADCLQWALDNDIRYGLWGGQSAYQRDQIRKGIKPPPRGRPPVNGYACTVCGAPIPPKANGGAVRQCSDPCRRESARRRARGYAEKRRAA